MSNVWLKLNRSLQHECGTGCAVLDAQTSEGRLSPCVPTPFAPLLSSELPCTTCCDIIWPSFGTNPSFTIQFTSVLFSLVGAIKAVALGKNLIAKKANNADILWQTSVIRWLLS